MTSKAKNNKIEGVTKSGFAYSIDKNRLQNYELLEVLVDVDENPILMPKLLVMLMGKEEKDKLIDFLRIEDGTVPSDKVAETIAEIFEEVGELKN